MDSLLLSAVTLSAALALFVALYKLIRSEIRNNKRIVLVRPRGRLDELIDWVSQKVASAYRAILQSLHGSRQSRTNRQLTNALMRHATYVPLTVTHTNNHLSQMSDHKSETALSPAQGRTLRNKKLEERF